MAKQSDYMKMKAGIAKNYFNIDMSHSSVESRVGVCKNSLHNGYLTVALMREHQCIEKNCGFFVKYEDAPYWKEKEKKRKERKEGKQIKKEEELFRGQMLDRARELTKDREDFAILNIYKNDKYYYIRYVSMEKQDLREFVAQMREEFGWKILMMPIQNSDKSFRKELIEKYKIL